MPLAATTYYFDSRDELVGAALQSLADAWLAGAQAVLDGLPASIDDAATLARAVLDVALGGADQDDAAVLTMYERFLQAGRSPRLRAVVTAYGATLDGLLLEVLRRSSPRADEHVVRRVLAALDGTVLRALAEGRPVVPAAVAAVTPLLPVTTGPADARTDAGRRGPATRGGRTGRGRPR